ncbi:GH25 family lysozyme [Shinella sp. S4-D37]|uniref:glycoside hydrolase family 25 protein n=1 Tax=Shinella sp. S4-D37 TaxID=3161999 RepID=UPI00346733D1
MNPKHLSGLAALLLLATLPFPAGAASVEPWKKPENAIVIDAYELNEIDWSEMLSDTRIAGFISKASDGLPESFSCKGEHGGDTVAHCKTMWRKYAVSRELYETRRLLARSKGLLWGAYHLARPGNPVDQANHFLDYANPQDDEMMVLDIEGIDPDAYMSLEDAQVFAGHIKTRTGRYPVLYTNHSTARFIALNRDKYRILSRLPLWYARYKPGIEDTFPMGNWDNYALWQFSAGVNCSKRRCPYRVKGALTDIDVNVAPMTKAALARSWAFGDLLPEKPFEAVDGMLTASIPAGGAFKATVRAEAEAGTGAQTAGAVTFASAGAASFPLAVTAEVHAGIMANGTTTTALGRRLVEVTPLNYQDF